MDPVEIARNQLLRLNERPRQPRKSDRKAITSKPTAKKLDDKTPEFDIDSITIDWQDDLPPEVPEISVTPPTKPPPNVIKKEIYWNLDENGVVSTESKVVMESPTSPKKRRTNEVDKLLGDEGVQLIMRDRQICIDDNGILLNMQKSTKTRQQRKKQEEPEKTPRDWNFCSMIVRRRSSDFSTDSFVLQETSAAIEPKAVLEHDDDQLIPPNITSLYRSLKLKMNPEINENFDLLNDRELNNNVEKRDSKVVQNGSPKKKAANAKKTLASVKFKMISVETDGFLVHLKILGKGLLSPKVCQELVIALTQQSENDQCNLVLLGPIKFVSTDAESSPSAGGGVYHQRQFLETLAQFPKGIYIAVQGSVEGVGVTMLPLFDMVFAKYGTEFCCSVADPLPGMSILMNSTKVDKNRMSELLFLGESATSTQAVSYGLVTREISSKNDKDFEDKVMQIAKETMPKRIRLLKRLWAESHLDQLLKDLRREESLL